MSFRVAPKEKENDRWWNSPWGYYVIETDAIDEGKRIVEREDRTVVVQKFQGVDNFETVCEIYPIPTIKAKVVYK